MLVLSWNLFHGRSLPPAGRDLMDDFAARLAGWEWDVALLQEVPPWWPPAMARGADASQRTALTSRNALLPLRRALAVRWPDIVKSQGGGANAILVRGARIERHVVKRVATKPERRVMHGVRLEDGTWVVNMHLTAHHPEQADAERAAAGAVALRWAGAAPVVLGGDLNRRSASLDGFVHAAHNDVDHVFARGLEAAGPFEVLDRGALSDHAPIRVELR